MHKKRVLRQQCNAAAKFVNHSDAHTLMPKNLKSRNRKASDRTLALIDELLFAPVKMRREGKVTRIPAVEAIMLQLISKMMAGNVRAGRVLLKYQNLAKREDEKTFELEFVEDGEITA